MLIGNHGGCRMTEANVNAQPSLELKAYSISEAAALLSLGRTRIYQAIYEGKLKAVKFGRRTLVRAEDINRFLDSLPAR